MSGQLRVFELGKAYRRWTSEWFRAASWFGFPVRPAEEHWVLRNINFSISPGEAVGIVGENGAGKSTLLKLITGTARATEGGVYRTGHVAAILELGMGFNLDLTGRQNAYHYAGLMGYSQFQIEGAIQDIEAFAEIGEYFDQPMRTYSSGMQMRVAFSAATAIRPDVLIVDEALSVGDAYFVHKCFDRIREFRKAGTTLLIVSHDPGAIQALCDRAIVLESGRLIIDAEPKEALDYYNALIAHKEASKLLVTRPGIHGAVTESGTFEATIDEVILLNSRGEPSEYVAVSEPVTLRVRVSVALDIERLVFGYMIRDRLGQAIFGTNTHHTAQVIHNPAAGEKIEFAAAFVADLGPGTYSISVALTGTEDHLSKNYQWRDMALVFTVANVGKNYFIGCAWIPPEIAISKIFRTPLCQDSLNGTPMRVG